MSSLQVGEAQSVTFINPYSHNNDTLDLICCAWFSGEVLKMLEEENVSLRDVEPAALDTM